MKQFFNKLSGIYHQENTDILNLGNTLILRKRLKLTPKRR